VQLSQAARIDDSRIYATGISNGAIFSQTLAVRMSDRLAAIAAVAGGMPVEVAAEMGTPLPVSVMILQGTSDPLMPYDGGSVARARRGAIVSTDSVVARWVHADGLSRTPRIDSIPDRVPRDGCRVTVQRWDGVDDVVAVELWRLDGGGHTWPGGPQYLPRRFIGNVCRDIDATQEIWRLFAGHPKR
jgi:polyhydroxybutyrate depolymerase